MVQQYRMHQFWFCCMVSLVVQQAGACYSRILLHRVGVSSRSTCSDMDNPMLPMIRSVTVWNIVRLISLAYYKRSVLSREKLSYWAIQWVAASPFTAPFLAIFAH